MSTPLSSGEPSDRLLECVQKAIEERVEELVGLEANMAAIRVQQQVRGEAAKIAARIFTTMTMERYGHELVIRVDFKNLKT